MTESDANLIADFILALDDKRENLCLPQAAAAIARYRSAVFADFVQRRNSLHATFNGGWHEPETLRAFHHGMDTVFNCIDAESKGEPRQA